MVHNAERNRSQLLRFTVPGLPQPSLAVTLREVLEVTTLPEVVPIPLAPSIVLGLSEWHGRVITLVDMTELLCGHLMDHFAQDSNWRYVIAQIVKGTQLDIIAWPIQPGASILVVPPQVMQEPLPPNLSNAMIHTSFTLDNQLIALLDLGRIAKMPLTYMSGIQQCN
jgi:chemotaxis signal transduction protein